MLGKGLATVTSVTRDLRALLVNAGLTARVTLVGRSRLFRSPTVVVAFRLRRSATRAPLNVPVGHSMPHEGHTGDDDEHDRIPAQHD